MVAGREHAELFLRLLHPNPSTTALVRFVALPQRRGDLPVTRWHYDPACVALDEILEFNARGYHTFVQINPCATMGETGGAFANVAGVHALVADIDTWKTGVRASKVIEMLAAFGLPPSVAVKSGNGGHLYLLLDKLYPADVAVVVAKRLCIATFSDAVHNPNRIMRLPGTVNWKEPPQLCSVHSYSERRYTLDEVTAALDAVGAPNVDEDLPLDDEARLRIGEPAPDLEALISRLPARLRFTVETGKPPVGWDDRSEIDWAVCRALIGSGATDAQIWTIYETYPVRGIKAGRAGSAYLERTIRRARAEEIRIAVESSPGVALVRTGFFIYDGGNVVPDMEAIRLAVRKAWDLDRIVSAPPAPQIVRN